VTDGWLTPGGGKWPSVKLNLCLTTGSVGTWDARFERSCTQFYESCMFEFDPLDFICILCAQCHYERKKNLLYYYTHPFFTCLKSGFVSYSMSVFLELSFCQNYQNFMWLWSSVWCILRIFSVGLLANGFSLSFLILFLEIWEDGFSLLNLALDKCGRRSYLGLMQDWGGS
jgi:hypothetical protein